MITSTVGPVLIAVIFIGCIGFWSLRGVTCLRTPRRRGTAVQAMVFAEFSFGCRWPGRRGSRCFPKGVRKPQAVKVVRKRLADHPENHYLIVFSEFGLASVHGRISLQAFTPHCPFARCNDSRPPGEAERQNFFS